jgi:hypothetical protein
MRWIDKSGPPPTALTEFLGLQRPVGLNLDYDSFTRKPQLRQELTAQQFGLCALTGAAIDGRLGQLAPDGYVVAALGERLKIKSHNAHLKPQAVCKREMTARGQEPGRHVGEDMDHRNLVAALLVEGAKDEMFGAAAQEEQLLRVKPTDRGCEGRFHLDGNGDVHGLDADARDTVDTLKLWHRTLVGWRKEAIGVYTDPGVIRSLADLDDVDDQGRQGALSRHGFSESSSPSKCRPLSKAPNTPRVAGQGRVP